MDVLIVGGGLVGQVLALGLDQLGYDVGLVESKPWKAPSSLADTRAIALSYGSVKILDFLNIWEKLKPDATPIDLVHVSEKGGFASCRLDKQALELDYLGQVLEIHVLLKNLMELVSQRKNIKIFSPAELDLNSLNSNTQKIIVNQGENNQKIPETLEIHAKLIIAADGRESGIKQALNLSSQTQRFNQIALVGNIKLKNSHQNIAYERFTSSGPLALLPINKNRATFIWVMKPEELEKRESLGKNNPAEFLKLLQQEFGYRAGRFEQLLSLQSHELIQSIAEQTYHNNILLMGNAAHALHPIAGQGFNLSLKDVGELLNQIKMSGDLSPEVIQCYLNLRAKDQKELVYFSSCLAELFTQDFCKFNSGFNSGLKILRGLGLFILEREKFCKKYMAQRLAGIL